MPPKIAPPTATQSGQVNCVKCRHYYITWDKICPHGCRAMGFKSAAIPSLEVYRNSGKPCQLFTSKVH